MTFLSSTFSIFIALVAVTHSVSGTPTTSPQISRRVLHESRDSIPHGWGLRRRADGDTVLPLKISLRQSNLANLDAYLLDIADPDSPRYGQHWTPTRLADTFRPSTAAVDAVREWLASADSGLVDAYSPDAAFSRVQLSADGAHIHVSVSVAEAERLLATEYYVYGHEASGEERVACHRGYHLPEHVAGHVELVTPTVHFERASALASGSTAADGLVRKRAGGVFNSDTSGMSRRPSGSRFMEPIGAVSSDLGDCDKSVTLECLRALYGLDYNLTVPEKNKVAVVELGHQSYNPGDMDGFFKQFSPEQVGQRPVEYDFDGGHTNFTQHSGTTESNMDFQLVMGLLGKTQPVDLYQLGGRTDDAWNLLLAGLDSTYCSFNGSANYGKDLDCGNKPTSYVVSVSYGLYEDPAIQQQACIEFGKMSLLGMTFVISSGDDGVGSGFHGECPLANGTGLSKKEGLWVLQFPASCPYVTSVGSTTIVPGNTVNDPEVATTAFASGGGFSDIFPRPSWQDRVVTKYLKNHTPSYGKGLFNSSGRAIPDVAANGWNTVVINGGKLTRSGGTSASAPIFASMIAAVNDARLAVGKGPVGFINPVLYSHLFAGVFNDITNGSSFGCGTQGFSCAAGWDPVTGLGTPNFKTMLGRFMILP